jgi:deoxyribonuclease V
MYKCAVDVYYGKNTAKTVGFLFNDWLDTQPSYTYSKRINGIEPYEPGAFYKRELPCITSILEEIDLKDLEVIIIDGYVYIDDQNTPGLGWHVFSYLKEAVPVIGVAKTKFYNNTRNVLEVTRGQSNRPLYITAIGMPVERAATCIKNMAGAFRIPHLLKQLDQISKEDKI